MKYKHLLLLICAPIFMATECNRGDSFFPDPGNPGLSIFTSRGYGVASAYINDDPYTVIASYYNTLLSKDSTGNSIDTSKFALDLSPHSGAIPVQGSSSNTISGSANLYFVTVTENLAHLPQKYIKLSGLFDGNIGDSVHITKGRFDFEVDESNLNF
jgi:hypothetical protein